MVIDYHNACRAAVVAHLKTNPGATSTSIFEALRSARFTTALLTNVMRVLRVEGVVETTNQRNTLVSVPEDHEADAVAHLESFGNLGTEILRLAREFKITPEYLLRGRGPNIGRQRGVLISQLEGPADRIAAALRMSVGTVEYYRPTRSEAA
jgi:hypothetical protein